MSKKRNKKIEYLLNAETKPKQISEIIGVSLWPLSSPDLNPLDYAVWSVLEKNTRHCQPNIGSIRTAIEEEWNKTSRLFLEGSEIP